METIISSTTEQSDEKDQQTIKTAKQPPLARLICTDASMDSSLEGLIVELEETQQTFGRAETNTVVINSMRVSRVHVRIFPENGHWLIEDLSSTNGLFVNKTQTLKVSLNHGDKISIASIPFRFELEYNKIETQPDSKPNLTARNIRNTLNQSPDATIVMQNSPFFTSESPRPHNKVSPRFGWYVALTLILLLTGVLIASVIA